LQGSIVEVSEMDLRVVPRLLLAAGDLPTRLDSQGVARPLGTVYQARVALEPQAASVLPGATGRAKIAVAPRSLGRRILQFLSTTFQFQL